jgi:hypothetical protein
MPEFARISLSGLSGNSTGELSTLSPDHAQTSEKLMTEK